MEVTIGHEFFHAIQNTYDPAHARIKAIWNSRGLCLYDASSTWFEGEMIDSPSYIGAPAMGEIFRGNPFYTKGLGYGCRSDPKGYGYGASTFLRYLTNKYGADLVLVLWRNILHGAGFDVPIDAMKAARVNVALDWEDFSQKLLLGTTGLGWPLPPADSTVVYTPGNGPMQITDTMYQLSAKKHRIDFTSLLNGSTASPTCRIRLNSGAGSYRVKLYHLTTQVAELDADFSPIASDKYSLIVTNIVDSQFTVDGVRYGQQTPVSITIDCGEVAWKSATVSFHIPVTTTGTEGVCVHRDHPDWDQPWWTEQSLSSCSANGSTTGPISITCDFASNNGGNGAIRKQFTAIIDGPRGQSFNSPPQYLWRVKGALTGDFVKSASYAWSSTGNYACNSVLRSGFSAPSSIGDWYLSVDLVP
jgi:hypothetical protein